MLETLNLKLNKTETNQYKITYDNYNSNNLKTSYLKTSFLYLQVNSFLGS